MAQPVKVVILGAGFAGLQAAKAFRKAKDVSVTIIDRTNHHVFQPLLYQVAMAGLNPSEIASPVRGILGRQKNLVSLMGTVTRVDYDQRYVELDYAQRLEFDYLILAMGGRTSYFGNDQWEAKAPGLKSLSDALEIRRRILSAFEMAERTEDEAERKRLTSVVIVGGGPTGVELAGSLCEFTRHVIRWDFKRIQPETTRVVLLDASPRLVAQFSDKLSAYTLKKLQKMGVEVHLGQKVVDIHDGGVDTQDHKFEAATVLWAAGVGGNPLAEALSADRDRAGRIIVESDMRVKGHERVYCLGDMASYVHPHTFGGKPLPGLAPVAIQQGGWAARNILRQIKGQPTEPFRYFDKGSMATIGRTAAVASSMGLEMTGLLAWLAWLFIHLLYIIDYRNRVVVLLRWTWAYFAWKWGARLITQIPHPRPPQGPSEAPDDGNKELRTGGAGGDS